MSTYATQLFVASQEEFEQACSLPASLSGEFDPKTGSGVVTFATQQAAQAAHLCLFSTVSYNRHGRAVVCYVPRKEGL